MNTADCFLQCQSEIPVPWEIYTCTLTMMVWSELAVGFVNLNLNVNARTLFKVITWLPLQSWEMFMAWPISASNGLWARYGGSFGWSRVDACWRDWSETVSLASACTPSRILNGLWARYGGSFGWSRVDACLRDWSETVSLASACTPSRILS